MLSAYISFLSAICKVKFHRFHISIIPAVTCFKGPIGLCTRSFLAVERAVPLSGVPIWHGKREVAGIRVEMRAGSEPQPLEA